MIDPSAPAFPWTFFDQKKDQMYTMKGLTIRAYFAAQALRGAIEWRDAHTDKPYEFDIKKLAQDCCAVADALIAELNRDPGEK